jgi:hypothetical protein
VIAEGIECLIQLGALRELGCPLHTAFLARLPAPLARAVAGGRRRARLAVGQLLRLVASKPTAGWALRRGMLVHGVDDPLALLDGMREYTLVGHAEQITCPTWVCSAEGDAISASAPALVQALRCEKA